MASLSTTNKSNYHKPIHMQVKYVEALETIPTCKSSKQLVEVSWLYQFKYSWCEMSVLFTFNRCDNLVWFIWQETVESHWFSAL